MREACKCLNLFRPVNRSHFSGLCYRNHPRLYMVLVADSMVGMLHRFNRQFPISRREGNELAPSEFFRRATLVCIDVGGLGADHGMVGLSQCLETKHVGGIPVEDEL